MKNIYSLFLLVCFVQYSLSSGDGITVNILGPVVQANECQEKYFIFYIPVSITGLEEGKTLKLSLPIDSPKGLTAQCESLLSQGVEYLGCSIDLLNTYFHDTQITLPKVYPGPDTINCEDWETFIGENPVVDLSATCPENLYEFSELSNFSDECYKEKNPEYHLLKAQGKLNLINKKELKSSEGVELEFNMELNVNSAKVVASCKINEIPVEQNSSDNGLLQCAFIGNGNAQFFQYLAQAATKEFVLVRDSEVYNLPNKCEKSDSSKSSWLSTSGLLLIALILL